MAMIDFNDASDDHHYALPRCDKLDGSSLRIVPAYTEAGRYCEANCIMVTDGERTAIYAPVRIVEPDEGKVVAAA